MQGLHSAEHADQLLRRRSSFAKAVARTLEQAHPELVVSDMKKKLREGKVLVD